ncbi:MAG: 50S ribosomal protein L22 [Acidobacteriota bacterium]|nr:50S ribosomal protein L22 [Acidobacteriota bacterium]MDW3229215.1 50S ribosomal protein L22 [Acidobacteriota bacterium]MDY0231237.1 50S ribosomal protein L22 [Candidatus Saccharicenans sp.]
MEKEQYLSKAVARYVRMSPQKGRLVADLIRNRLVGEALTILKFNQKKKISAILEKVLRSAIANAQQKSPNIDVDNLYIASIQIEQGPVMKRIRPAPQGRAYRVLKRMSHVKIYLDEKKGR